MFIIKEKVILFVIGILVGAAITSCAFYIYTSNTKSCECDSNKMQVDGNQQREMRGGQNFENGEMPEMPEGGNFENGQPPELPEGENFENGQPPEMPNSNNSRKGNKNSN